MTMAQKYDTMQLARLWLLEEVNELVDARNREAEIDAYFDMFGVLFHALRASCSCKKCAAGREVSNNIFFAKAPAFEKKNWLDPNSDEPMYTPTAEMALTYTKVIRSRYAGLFVVLDRALLEGNGDLVADVVISSLACYGSYAVDKGLNAFRTAQYARGRQIDPDHEKALVHVATEVALATVAPTFNGKPVNN